MKRIFRYCVAAVFAEAGIAFFGACSIQQLAIDMVIGALSGDGSASAFTGDDDPELVGDSLPFALKLYETLLAQSPDNVGLLLTTGSGFVMYANAYVQTPADMLPGSEFELRREMRRRAKRLYLRGRDYVLAGLDVSYPGFLSALEDGGYELYLQKMTVADVPFLHWAAAGWVAAISIDTFDVALGITREASYQLMLRALELDEEYGKGTIHEFFISYYGGLPAMMGGSEEKARFHFERAVEISGGTKPGPYVSLAQAVSVKTQDAAEFTSLLETALAIEPNDPDERLVTIITQRKATWLLEHIEDFFLLD